MTNRYQNQAKKAGSQERHPDGCHDKIFPMFQISNLTTRKKIESGVYGSADIFFCVICCVISQKLRNVAWPRVESV